MKLFALTTLTMVAFAANSIFCRHALADSRNDPLSFTVVRLISGALALAFFFVSRKPQQTSRDTKLDTLAPLLLVFYALFFSLAYVNMDAGTGALILFASVQLTMMVAAMVQGHKMALMEKIGFTLAFGGFIYLLLPGLNMPPILAASLMVVSGVSWGLYSLLGRTSASPIYQTARNFVMASPLALAAAIVFPFELTSEGFLWSALSGAITSALGYVLWYSVLKELATSTAAIVQLSVPSIAAFGGVLFLNESIPLRLIVASILILGGILLKVQSGTRQTQT